MTAVLKAGQPAITTGAKMQTALIKVAWLSCSFRSLDREQRHSSRANWTHRRRDACCRPLGLLRSPVVRNPGPNWNCLSLGWGKSAREMGRRSVFSEVKVTDQHASRDRTQSAKEPVAGQLHLHGLNDSDAARNHANERCKIESAVRCRRAPAFGGIPSVRFALCSCNHNNLLRELA
jgi:hypothetical protein